MSTPRWMQGKPVEEKQKPRWMQGRAVDSGPLARNTAMDLAAERANAAYRSNQPIAPDDLAQLGRLDFSPAAMSRLPPVIPNAQAEEEGQAWISAMEKGGKEKRAYDAAVRQEKMMRQLPDSDFKERLIIAMNVPTYGSGPRLAAGAQTVGALLATPFVEDDIIDREGVSGAMSQFLDEARTHQRRGRTERPAESIGIEVVPSLFQGKTIIDTLGKKVLPGTSTLSNVSRVAGVGTGYGALYAGSQNESGTVEGVARDAAVGGALGAGFGLGFKAAEPAVTAGYRSAKTGAATISDALSELLGKAGGARDKVAQEVALAAVRRSMERSGMTFDEIMGLVKRYEGKPAVLAEVIGQDAVNALTALTRRPGSTPQKAQDIIEERFFERPARMAADVEEATGIQIGQLDSTLDAQLIARQEAAKPIYDALYKQYSTIKSFGESLKRINRLARTPAMQKHLTLAEEAVKTQAALRQVPVSKMSKMEYWDLVKRSLDDEINSAVAKGEARTKIGASVADLTQLKKGLTDEFDRLTDGAYAAARKAGGEAPRLRAAAVAGQKALGARNARETAKTVAATLPQDMAGFRAGVVDDLGTRIERGMVPGRVRLPDVANKLRAALGDEPANRIISRLDAEANLAESGANWAPRMKSPTGTVMESGPSAFGDDLVNAGMNLATGNKLGLLRQAINFMRQRGFSQRQIDAIGDLLLSSPEEGLRRLQVIKPEGPPAGLAAPVAGGAPPVPPAGGTPPRSAGFGIGPGTQATLQQSAFGSLGGSAYGSQNDVNGDGVIDERDAYAGAFMGGIGLPLAARGVRTVGRPRGALADTATAGMGGNGSGNAGRFRFGPTGKAFNPWSTKVQDEIIRTSGGTIDARNIDDLMSTYTDDLFDSTPQEIVDTLRRQAGEVPLAPRDVEYLAFAELMARNLMPMRKGAEDILTAGIGGGGRAPIRVKGMSKGEGNKHGLMPHLRMQSSQPPAGKAKLVQDTNAANAPRQIDELDNILKAHPNALDSSQGWAKMMSDALGSDDVPVAPYAFIRDIKDGTAQKTVQSLTPGQIADADHGFSNAAKMREVYVSGKAKPSDTGSLFAWGFLSRGVSPYTQESLFIDAFNGLGKWIDDAANGTFDIDEYLKWAKTAAPKGSNQPGAGASHNLNAFGSLFLRRMSEIMPGTNISKMEYLHNLMSNPNMTGPQIRREFARIGQGVGIDNKVVSFTLLVSGRDDVMVLDRVQVRKLWNDGRFDGINLYDGYKVDGAVVTGSALSNLTYGARGLLIYEAIERHLAKNLKNIYAGSGREADASIGRYHWETWVADSQQEASHGTLDAILKRMVGDEDPMAGVVAKQGEYGSYSYGARYGRSGAGEPFIEYPTPSGAVYRMTPQDFAAFREEIKKPPSGIIPRGKFSVSDAGDQPWYNKEGVNKGALDDLAARYGKRVDDGRFSGTDGRPGQGQDPADRRQNDLSGAAGKEPKGAKQSSATEGRRTVGKPKKPSKIGTRTADAAAIATLGLQGGTAEADTGGLSAELQAANERIALAEKTVADTRSGITNLQSQLEMLQDPAGDIAAKQSILKLRGRYLGTTGPKGDGVDGVDGPNTILAINDEAAKIEAAIAREQASLEKAQAAETKAFEAAKQIRMQKIQADAQPGKNTELAREFGPYGGVAAGIAAAYLMRRGAGQKFAKASQVAANNANALLTDAPISLRAGVQHPNSINVRATKLNDFARQGGAPSGTTPFDDKQTGSFRPRAKKNTVDPSDLYPKPGFMAARLRIPDYGWSATGLIEGQVAGGFRAKEEKKIAEYEKDVERFAASGDEAGLQRASANLQQAKNMYAIALAFERAGYAYAGTRMLAGLKDPYKFVRPDIKGYEAEASSLRTAMNKK